MSPLRGGYLALALTGAGQALFAMWHGARLTLPIPFAPGMEGQAALVTLALILWALAETRVRRNWTALISIPAALMLGPGCGLPLYLFLRTRPVV
ncbi:MAG: DUF2834 domain-containing protein [Gemmobacter sp.]|jgi:hypothetical protein|nr:DUF2834 domain-containing protein [Gemmobacter sp.]